MHRKKSNLVDYRKVSRVTYDGVMYDSKFEAGYAMELDIRKKSGDIKDWTYHKVYSLTVNGELISRYEIDFLVHHNDGQTEHVECKGFMDNYANIRWKLYQAIIPYENPDHYCTLVRQKSQWGKRKFGSWR